MGELDLDDDPPGNICICLSTHCPHGPITVVKTENPNLLISSSTLCLSFNTKDIVANIQGI